MTQTYGQDEPALQEVTYTINASFNEAKKIISGDIEIEYAHKSKVPLDKIYLYLTPNAFSNKNTHFAKSALAFGNTELHFASQSDLGSIDSLDFTIDGQKANWRIDPNYEDIALLFLPNSISQDDQITIRTTFKVKIPSILGFITDDENSYLLSDWYPRPAVFEAQGWNTTPLTYPVETYNLFGDYNVKIQIPNSLLPVASGILTDQTESKDFSTYHFEGKSLNEFVIFLLGNHQKKSKLLTESGRNIEVNLYLPTDHSVDEESVFRDCQESIQYFGDRLGEYHYPLLNLVYQKQKPNVKSYPMLGIFGQSSNLKIQFSKLSHILAHHWFGHKIASNPNTSYWIEEGLAFFYEGRMVYDRYKEDIFGPLRMNTRKNAEINYPYISYLSQAYRNEDISPEPTRASSNLNSFRISQMFKPALSFNLLSHYVGEEKMDSAVHTFLNQKLDKNIAASDFQNALESNLDMDLDWFFDGLINSSEKVDYKIQSVDKRGSKYRVELKNKGQINSPVKLSAYTDHEKVFEEWIDGFSKQQKIVINNPDVDWITLDDEGVSLDANRANNHYHTKGLFKKTRNTKYGFGGIEDDSRFQKRYLLPLFGFNKYDGFMLGLIDYDPIFPGKNFTSEFIPAYGFGSSTLVGVNNYRYEWYPSNSFAERMAVGLRIKSFNYDELTIEDESLRYWTIKPFLEMSFGSQASSNDFQKLRYQFSYVNTEDDKFADGLQNQFYIHQLDYQFKRDHPILPWKIKSGLEYQSYKVFQISEDSHNYIKLKAEFNLGYQFQKNKHVDFRLFASTFLKNTRRQSNSYLPPFVRGATPLTFQGFNDYVFDDFFFGRTEQDGIWSQQVLLKEGGFKVPLGSSFGFFGHSNNFLVTFNFESDLPVNLPDFVPLRFYFDAGIVSNKRNAPDPLQNEFLFSGGLMFEILDGILEVYFPFFNSSEINDLYNSIDAGYGRRISFSIDLAKLHPDRVIEEL